MSGLRVVQREYAGHESEARDELEKLKNNSNAKPGESAQRRNKDEKK